MFDVITIGAGLRDVFLVSKKFKFINSSAFDGGVGECVALGAKIELDQIVHATGGGAANAACTFAQLGLKTAVVCRVGDDSAGRDVTLDLERKGIATGLIRRVPKGTTGYSTLLTASSGERTVLVYRGVSSSFSPADVAWKTCAGKWFYVTSIGGNLEVVKRIVRHAASCGASLAWNPGSLELKKGLPAIQSILPHVRVLNFNREEAEALTKQKKIPEIMRGLATPGNIVIVTDGARGAYAHKDGTTWFVATQKVKAVSRTGAGDAFGSGFVAAYAKTNAIEPSLALATLNAQSVIEHIGAQAGILKKWPTAAQIKSISIKTL